MALASLRRSRLQRGRTVDKKGPPIMTVPTTAGTGADVTAGCGVFDPDSGIKLWAGGPNVRPSVSLCDPGP
jgi:choline dehydrogenase